MQLYSPPIGNLWKLQLKWSGPLQITEIMNQAMVMIREINVPNPCQYDAHISKLQLAKKFGEQDLNPFSYYQDYQKKTCYSCPTNSPKSIYRVRLMIN